MSSSPWAPTAIVLPSPLTDTAPPNPSPTAPSGAVSLRRAGVPPPHRPEGLVNTYAAPESLPLSSSPWAPTAMTLPSALADTDQPNELPLSMSMLEILGALVVSSQPAAGSVKTCAAPVDAQFGMVAVTVLPSALTDTECPKCPNGRPSRKVAAVVVTAHPSDGIVNTYATPAFSPSASLPGAPTAIVLPSEFVDTDQPN